MNRKSIYYGSAIDYHTNKTMSNVYPLQHQIDRTQLYWYMSLIQSILLWSYIIKLTHQSNNTNQYNRKQISHIVDFRIPYVLSKFTLHLLPFSLNSSTWLISDLSYFEPRTTNYTKKLNDSDFDCVIISWYFWTIKRKMVTNRYEYWRYALKLL